MDWMSLRAFCASVLCERFVRAFCAKQSPVARGLLRREERLAFGVLRDPRNDIAKG